MFEAWEKKKEEPKKELTRATLFQEREYERLHRALKRRAFVPTTRDKVEWKKPEDKPEVIDGR